MDQPIAGFRRALVRVWLEVGWHELVLQQPQLPRSSHRLRAVGRI
jgi:hypothetical protein